MKKLFLFKMPARMVFAMLILCSLSFHSCKKSENGGETILNSPATDATIGVQFVNAKTGEPVFFNNITSQGVTVVIGGVDNDKIVDVAGTREFKTAQGFLGLALKTGVTPTESSPIRFHITASATGYLSTSMPVILHEKGGVNVTIKMIELVNPPAGVGMNVNTMLDTDNNGYTTNSIDFSTYPPTTNQEKTIASLVVDQGTLFTDKDNNKISADVIKTTLIYFNNLDDSSIEAFNGGLSGTTAANEDVFFTSGGLVSVEIKNKDNRAVRYLGQPVHIKVEIPASTRNADGNTISAGMTVPIWSYDPETGKWTQETTSTIQMNGNGKYEVNFDASHLSFWSVDWFKTSCQVGTTVNVSGNISCKTNLFYELRNSATGALMQSGMKNFAAGSSFRFMRTPPNTAAVLKVYESMHNRTTPLASVNISDLCSGTNSIEVNLPTAPESVNLVINNTCSSRQNFIFRATTPLYTKEIVGGTTANLWQYVGALENGQINTCKLVKGKTYTFGAYYDGRLSISPEYTIDQNSFIISQLLSSTTCGKLN